MKHWRPFMLWFPIFVIWAAAAQWWLVTVVLGLNSGLALAVALLGDDQ